LGTFYGQTKRAILAAELAPFLRARDTVTLACRSLGTAAVLADANQNETTHAPSTVGLMMRCKPSIDPFGRFYDQTKGAVAAAALRKVPPLW
jgi:hypothetical protein